MTFHKEQAPIVLKLGACMLVPMPAGTGFPYSYYQDMEGDDYTACGMRTCDIFAPVQHSATRFVLAPTYNI